MRSQEPDAIESIDVVDGSKQCCQAGPIGKVHAIAVDNLAEQRDFAHAGGGQGGDLAAHRLETSAALDAASEGNDTEGTCVRAAMNGADIGCHLTLAASRQGNFAIHESMPPNGFEAFGKGWVPRRQERDQWLGVGWRREDVDEWIALTKAVVVLDAHEAAHQVDDHLGPLVLERAEPAKLAMGSVFRTLADNTSVEHNDVRLMRVRGREQAELFQ